MKIVGDGERVGNTVRASVWGEEIPHVRYIHAKIMDCSVSVLFRSVAVLYFRDTAFEISGTA